MEAVAEVKKLKSLEAELGVRGTLAQVRREGGRAGGREGGRVGKEPKARSLGRGALWHR